MAISIIPPVSGSGSGSSGANSDFDINTGSNAYSKFTLTETFPAGSYVVKSLNSDTTYDVYLIGTDASYAGSVSAIAASSSITATKDFNAVVVYGTLPNDTFSFTFKNIYTSVADSTADIAVAPVVLSHTPSFMANNNDTITVTGRNFASDVEITFIGTDSTSRSAKSIVRSSSTSLLVTRPDAFPQSASPYTIQAVNPGIPSPVSSNLYKLTNSVTAGVAPVWVTGSTLPAYTKTVAYSQAILATDADGGSSVTYSIVSNTLPSGLSFNTSTATISGTATANSLTPYGITVRATDAGGNFVDRAFSIIQAVADAPTLTGATDVGTGRAFNNGAVTVSFNAPAFAGTSSITSYTVTSSGGHTGTGASSPIVVAGLSSDTGYTFTVTATNSTGASQPSTASSSITATTVPASPTIGTVTTPLIGVFSASVPFTANATGGKAISSYTVSSSPSSLTASGASSPLSVTGLGQGVAYTYAVAATNANGTSAYSSASNSTTTSVTTFVDSFDRATGALGTSSDGISTWSVQRGNFSISSNMAYSTDTNDSLATVPMSSSTISNAQANMYSDQGGTGLAFWVTDANSWWSIYPSYSSTTTSTTVATCSGTVYNGFEYQNTPGDACNRSCSSIQVFLYCDGGTLAAVVERTTCGTTLAQRTPTVNYCNGIGEGWYQVCQGGSCYAGQSGTSTTYATTYASSINIKNQSGVQHTNVYSAATTPVNSIAISTSGNTISYSAYSAINKGGSVLATSSYTPASPTKGTRIGAFKTSSQISQGSYVDNISATVV
jgi:hypothetical protein